MIVHKLELNHIYPFYLAPSELADCVWKVGYTVLLVPWVRRPLAANFRASWVSLIEPVSVPITLNSLSIKTIGSSPAKA